MSGEITQPISLDFVSFQVDGPSSSQSLKTFTSYSFQRNLLTPASPFRFTAPGVDKATRLNIRSGDMVSLFVTNKSKVVLPLATGFIDETDTNVLPERIEYVLTGRDTMGALVDNAAVDAANKVIYVEKITLAGVLDTLIKNTRIPAGYQVQQLPNGPLLFQTNPGETKINAIQRYLEMMNCLLWSLPNGQLVIGKPNFSQAPSGSVILNRANPNNNNCLNARVRRNVNTAIRTISTQLQTQANVDAGSFTVQNNDADLITKTKGGVGRSVFRVFSYGQGSDAVNLVTQVGNQSGSPNIIGNSLSLREIARANMQIIDVEAVIRGHVNEADQAYNIDQIYNVQIEDENVSENMYVYDVKYDLTMDHGQLTTLRLCRLGTIVDGADQIPRKQ